MKYIPRKFQVDALRFILKNRSVGLFMRMATGKTIVVLTAIKLLMYEAFRIKRVLLVAPIRVARITWPDEIAKWQHTRNLSYSFLHGTNKNKMIQQIKDNDITAVNYEGLQWLYNNRHSLPKFDMLIVDESTWVKTPLAIRTILIHKISRFIPIKIILTGTPAPNGLMDIWSQIFILDRGRRLGDCISHYRSMYFDPDGERGYYLRTGSKKKIIRKIADIVLVVENSELEGLPKVVDNPIKVSLPKSLQKKYKELENDFYTILPNYHEIDVLNEQAQTQKLRQFVSGFVYDDDKKAIHVHNEKLRALKELIESLNGNVLVAINFKEEVYMIQKYLKKKIPFINSTSTTNEDVINIRKFQRGELKILLAHPKSIGHGLNLQTGGSDTIWFSPTWSQEEWDQYTKRLARLGQKSDRVMNHIIMMEGTIDVPILNSVKRKCVTQNAFMNDLKEWRKTDAFTRENKNN